MQLHHQSMRAVLMSPLGKGIFAFLPRVTLYCCNGSTQSEWIKAKKGERIFAELLLLILPPSWPQKPLFLNSLPHLLPCTRAFLEALACSYGHAVLTAVAQLQCDESCFATTINHNAPSKDNFSQYCRPIGLGPKSFAITLF